MTDPLVVRLLGSPQFSIAASPIACPSKKSLALFAFVVLTHKAHSRHELAALLWGHREESARASLRSALHRLPTAMAECLRVGRETVGPGTPAPALLVDVARFETLACASDLESLEAAAALYQAELLEDFEASATPEFDDWLHTERVRLRQLAQRVFDSVIARRSELARHDVARAASERDSALATGLRWISLMPDSETAHRWLMRLYLDMGRGDAALAQYELCQRSLAVTQGRSPSTETRTLHRIALAGGGQSATAREAERSSDDAHFPLPVDGAAITATSFVGRLEELAELDRLLCDPACRLITLHGRGGSGKTRLAYAFAAQVASRFAHGVTWVALENAETPDALPRALAEALGRDVPQTDDPASGVAEVLARHERLIVLDNFESVLHGGGALDDAASVGVLLKILQAAPRVRILITSREVLRVQEEWVYEVRGLAHQPASSASRSQAPLPAVDLFAQRARQAYLGFSLSAEWPHVLRICSLVEGFPLGIELAAAWVRTLPCAELASAIESQAGALASPHRNRPHRHENLNAVVACSWNLLGDAHRDALAALGVFVGGFTRESAERVAEVPLRALCALVDKSLVRRRTEGRYDLHELVRQFALARLREKRTRHTAVTRRHSDYFEALLLDIAVDIRSSAEVTADTLFRNELANLLAAWDRSLQACALRVVERIAAPMIALLVTRGMVSAALAQAERAVDALDQRGRGDVTSMVRMQWGRAAIAGGKPDIARRELDRALFDARAGGKPDAIARCLYYRCALDYQQGRLQEAEAGAEEALSLAANSDDPEVRMLVHNTRGTLANTRSQFDLAEALLRQGLAAARAMGAPPQ